MKSLFLLLMLVGLILSAGCDDKQVVKIGDNAPAISINDIYGEHISLSQLKGKVVIIYFWTNSCCGHGVKQLEPFYNRYKKAGIEILAINEMDSTKSVEAYAKDNALTFTILKDEHSILLRDYFAIGFPTIFILDKNGVIREKINGNISIEKLQTLVEKQLKIQKIMETDYEKTHPR